MPATVTNVTHSTDAVKYDSPINIKRFKEDLMPFDRSPFTTYALVGVYRRNLGDWQYVDSYRNVTLSAARSQYVETYLHDEADGTEIVFLSSSAIIGILRVEVPEPQPDLVQVAVR